MYISIFIYMYMYMFIRIYAYIYTYIYTCIYLHLCLHAEAGLYVDAFAIQFARGIECGSCVWQCDASLL